jgi:serine phosphatase RsbU (regulator of sigma subunit)
MAKNLSEARETELALSIRDRERAVAGEVREALLSEVAPQLPGYDIGVVHEVAQELGGDFQDALVLADGRLGLLVCDVSGKGVPAAPDRRHGARLPALASRARRRRGAERCVKPTARSRATCARACS